MANHYAEEYYKYDAHQRTLAILKMFENNNSDGNPTQSSLSLSGTIPSIEAQDRSSHSTLGQNCVTNVNYKPFDFEKHFESQLIPLQRIVTIEDVKRHVREQHKKSEGFQYDFPGAGCGYCHVQIPCRRQYCEGDLYRPGCEECSVTFPSMLKKPCQDEVNCSACREGYPICSETGCAHHTSDEDLAAATALIQIRSNAAMRMAGVRQRMQEQEDAVGFRKNASGAPSYSVEPSTFMSRHSPLHRQNATGRLDQPHRQPNIPIYPYDEGDSDATVVTPYDSDYNILNESVKEADITKRPKINQSKAVPSKKGKKRSRRTSTNTPAGTSNVIRPNELPGSELNLSSPISTSNRVTKVTKRNLD